MSTKTSSTPRFFVYLDQNVISEARADKPSRRAVLDFLDRISETGGHFVISSVNVDESRDSGRAETFLEVVTQIGASVIEPFRRTGEVVPVSERTNEDLFLSEPDIAQDAENLLNRLLVPLQYASGWLGTAETSELKQEIVDQVHGFWDRLVHDIPQPFKAKFYEGKDAMITSLDSLDWDSMKSDAGDAKDRLLENLAQEGIVLADLAPRDALDSIFDNLAADEREGIQSQHPPGFWEDWEYREYGKLTGFAFMLFMLGLIDDKDTRRKGLQRRQRRFLSHFRDCSHIEAASYCQYFITCDHDAARLARATYDYSGTSTRVECIRIVEPDNTDSVSR